MVPTSLRRLSMDNQYPLNPDTKSGDPIGLSIVTNTAYKGARTTAKDLLTNAPINLRILVKTHVARVMFSPDDPVKAIGIETVDGHQIHAKHDVILSAGAIDTPKPLLLSGIGAAEQLKQFDIPVRLDLPAVGKGLKDHSHITPTWIRATLTIEASSCKLRRANSGGSTGQERYPRFLVYILLDSSRTTRYTKALNSMLCLRTANAICSSRRCRCTSLFSIVHRQSSSSHRLRNL